MLKVAYNAVPFAPGGGLNDTVNYLQAWQEIGARLDITVFASRAIVLDAVKAVRADVKLVPFALGLTSTRRFLAQQTRLGPMIEASKPDVVLSPHKLGRCRVPQLMRHFNLKRFVYPNFLARLRAGQILDGARDYTARVSLRDAVCNVFISHYMRQEAEKLVPESAPRNHVVYNGVSRQLLASSQRCEPAWSGRPHLMALQSPSVHKNNPVLLEALKLLVQTESGLHWELSIAGAGDWSGVRELALRMGVADRVRFLGYISQEEIDLIMRDSVCLVYPSKVEGFGLPPIEAMARRCPVVASNATALPEIIGDAGILVDPERPQAFAEGVRSLYHDRMLRQELVDRGLQRAQLFRWTDSAQQMVSLFESCLE